jgi:hypothetical protein
VNEEDFTAAQALVKTLAEAAEHSQDAPWKCAGCGEELEGQFTACWKCGEERNA